MFSEICEVIGYDLLIRKRSYGTENIIDLPLKK